MITHNWEKKNNGKIHVIIFVCVYDLFFWNSGGAECLEMTRNPIKPFPAIQNMPWIIKTPTKMNDLVVNTH